MVRGSPHATNAFPCPIQGKRKVHGRFHEGRYLPSRPRPVLPVPGPQVLCRFQDGTSAFRYSTDTHHDSRRRHLTRRLPLFPSCLSSSRTVHPTTTPTSTLTSPHAPSPPQCSPRDRNKNPQGIKSTTAARLGRDSRAASDTAWTTALALAISRGLSTSFRRPGLKPSLPSSHPEPHTGRTTLRGPVSPVLPSVHSGSLHSRWPWPYRLQHPPPA